MGYIEGVSRGQILMLPPSLDEFVDEENAVRVIDVYVDGLDMACLGFEKAVPAQTGRPAYSPRDMLKLYVYGYMNRIRSSRRLETESRRNLEVIWLLGRLSPDHKTISRFRKDNPLALKNVFRDFVKMCMKMKLYGRELAAIDGSKFSASNSIGRNFSARELDKRIKRLDGRIDEYMQQLSEADEAEGQSMEEGDVKGIIERLSRRKCAYESYVEELSQSGETQISLTDPDARMMKGAHGFGVSYNVQVSVDSKHGLIAEFDVTQEGNDIKQLSGMALATADILEAPNITATADGGYNSGGEIAKCIEKGITPHVTGSQGEICVPCEAHEAHKVESHDNGRGTYIGERNIVICPMGNAMPPKYFKKDDRTAQHYDGKACSSCKCKCTPSKFKTFGIRMKRSEFSKECDLDNLHVKQIVISPDKSITDRRKGLAEHPFGTIKRNMDAGYLLTRGLGNVKGEMSLAVLAYNLKRAINIMGTKRLLEAMI